MDIATLLIGSVAIAAHTMLFVFVANQASCLPEVPTPLYYLPQRVVAVGCIGVGLWSIVRASKARRSEAPNALIAAHVVFAIVLFVAAAVRFAFVGFTTGSATCRLLP